MKRIALLLVGLAFSACQTPTDDYRELLYVNVTLDPSERMQRVVVDRSFRTEDSIAAKRTWPGIRDAEVRMWPQHPKPRDTSGERSLLVYTWNQTCAEYRTERRVMPCSTYEISIRWRDTLEQKDFFGHMSITVPDTFGITSPHEGAILSPDSLPMLAWRRSADASGYVVMARTSRGMSYPYITRDTCIRLSEYGNVFFDSSRSDWYLISVFAWNQDLYRQKIERANRFGIDTIGIDVIADYGAQTSAEVSVRYAP